jgi:ribosome biogenesis GTPase
LEAEESALIRARICLRKGERARVLVDGRECDALVGDARPVIGDWVTARWVAPEQLSIEAIEPRRSRITRRAAGRASVEQVLAANVDYAFIVCGLDGDFNVRRIERYLAMVHEGGVRPVVVLNKADVAHEVAAKRRAAEAVVRSAGVYTVSAQTGEGMPELEALLCADVTAVLLGSSGAGKSSLLNRLLGSERQRTGAVRESDSSGRHTTTHRELIVLPGGAFVIDTPGLREIQLLVGVDALDLVFEEIATLAAQCRFGDCTHTVEPDCAVRGVVPVDRLDSFHKLRGEVLLERATKRMRT